MAPPQIEHIDQLVDRWRIAGLEFLQDKVPTILVDLILAIILIRLLKMITRPLARYSREAAPGGVRGQQLRTLGGVINGVGLFVIVFVTGLQILPLLNINIAPLLASAGIAGLAIGFGAQTLVKDVINGFFILLESQYDIGDMIRVAGVAGTVEYMTLRRTVLRDVDGAVHVIPNSQITIVSNLTRDWAQITLHISVGYSENSERVIELLKEIGRDVRNDPFYGELLVAEPEVPGIERVAGTEVDYLMLAKTRPGKQYAVKRELRRRIKDCFEKNNIQPGGSAKVYVLDNAPRQES
jgi:moderate conductance mechanosensitive channel